MAAYQQAAGSTIGSLLRKIKEEATQTAPTSPTTNVESPVRQAVAEPYYNQESPGSARQVSLRPELASTMGQPGMETPRPASIGPAAIGGGMGTPGVDFPASRPRLERSIFSTSVGPSSTGQQPVESQRAGEPTSTPKSTGQVLGTQISSANQYYKDLSSKVSKSLEQNIPTSPNVQSWSEIQAEIKRAEEPLLMAQAGSVREQIAKVKAAQTPKPTPTPTPAPTQDTGKYKPIYVNGRWMTWNPATNNYQ